MRGPEVLPGWTVDALAAASPVRPTLLLLRHAARGALPADDAGNDVPLLPEGVQAARALGAGLGSRLVTLRSSPVRRCVETAEALAAGAGAAVGWVGDTLLGHPGAFVEDGAAAWRTWSALGHEQVMERLVAGDHLPGLAEPVAATRRLLGHLRAVAAGRPGFHVYVSHDSLVVTAAAHALGRRIARADWPGFLEALVLVDEGARLVARYREWAATLDLR